VRLAPVAVGAAARAASRLALGPANVFAPSAVAHAVTDDAVLSLADNTAAPAPAAGAPSRRERPPP
jgi:hypothetical protein